MLTLRFPHLLLDLLDLFRNVHHPGTRLFIDGNTVLLKKNNNEKPRKD